MHVPLPQPLPPATSQVPKYVMRLLSTSPLLSPATVITPPSAERPARPGLPHSLLRSPHCRRCPLPTPHPEGPFRSMNQATDSPAFRSQQHSGHGPHSFTCSEHCRIQPRRLCSPSPHAHSSAPLFSCAPTPAPPRPLSSPRSLCTLFQLRVLVASRPFPLLEQSSPPTSPGLRLDLSANVTFTDTSP